MIVALGALVMHVADRDNTDTNLLVRQTVLTVFTPVTTLISYNSKMRYFWSSRQLAFSLKGSENFVCFSNQPVM